MDQKTSPIDITSILETISDFNMTGVMIFHYNENGEREPKDIADLPWEEVHAWLQRQKEAQGEHGWSYMEELVKILHKNLRITQHFSGVEKNYQE